MLHRHLTDGILLLAPGAERATAVLGTGAALWELLAEPATTPALVDELTRRYDATASVVAADTDEALRQLVDHGLVEALP